MGPHGAARHFGWPPGVTQGEFAFDAGGDSRFDPSMARTAFVAPAWTGHLNPMTTLARVVGRRGHEVTVLSFPDAVDAITRAGLRAEVIGESRFPDGNWAHRTAELAVLHGLSASRYTIRWIEDITSVMLTELPARLSGGRFDGLVMDQVCYGAECAADMTDTPLAVACNALPVHMQPDVPVHSETWSYSTGRLARFRNRLAQRLIVGFARGFLRPIRAAREARGHAWDVWQHMNELPPSLVQVAQLPACLDFPRRHSPAHFHHTGPWHESKGAAMAGFDWSWLDGRPLIYASLGTLQNRLDHLYQVILDACAGLPVQLVLTLVREDGNRPARVPPNAMVLGYGPQLALLQRASLVITHAGLNTTLETLALGLPIVALPIANEQPGIAARIRHVGAGEWLSIRRLRPGPLRAAIEKVRQDPRYRERARDCARQMTSVDGLARAAQLIEEAFTTRRPTLRPHGPIDS